MIDFNYFHNRLIQYKKAIQFNQFSRKLIQIRAAEKISSLFQSSQGERPFVLPKDIVIRVTERCFLNCKFCAQGGEKGRVDRHNIDDEPVGPEVFQKIINEASNWPIKPFIKITGGEPLVLGSKLTDAIREMRERKFVVKLNTNGMLLKNKRVAKRLVETDLNYLSISLDGGKEIHNELRGNPNLFDSMMQGVDNIKEFRKELGKKNVMILISMVVSSETQDQIENVYRIAVDKKVDWFNIQFVNYTTEETCSQATKYAANRFGIKESPWTAFCNPRFNKIDPEYIENQIKKIVSLRKSVPISVMGGMDSKENISKYYFSLDPIKKNICYIPFTGMHIVPPGKAVYCIDYPFYEYGDLRESSLKSIWYGKKAMDFRKELMAYYKEKKINLPQCQRCNWRFN